ncbi:protein tag-52-related [Anaeramoeba flamelloides]|uniref:Protein tag-52-related n=1 Tax=Anaeramoeba flamelloides TaxID=1746091 RepID=A0ABQ8Z3R6_9EUKA|nr:protein tag-52-related [Anaeramoeba flamelloides]
MSTESEKGSKDNCLTTQPKKQEKKERKQKEKFSYLKKKRSNSQDEEIAFIEIKPPTTNKQKRKIKKRTNTKSIKKVLFTQSKYQFDENLNNDIFEQISKFPKDLQQKISEIDNLPTSSQANSLKEIIVRLIAQHDKERQSQNTTLRVFRSQLKQQKIEKEKLQQKIEQINSKENEGNLMIEATNHLIEEMKNQIFEEKKKSDQYQKEKLQLEKKYDLLARKMKESSLVSENNEKNWLKEKQYLKRKIVRLGTELKSTKINQEIMDNQVKKIPSSVQFILQKDEIRKEKDNENGKSDTKSLTKEEIKENSTMPNKNENGNGNKNKNKNGNGNGNENKNGNQNKIGQEYGNEIGNQKGNGNEKEQENFDEFPTQKENENEIEIEIDLDTEIESDFENENGATTKDDTEKKYIEKSSFENFLKQQTKEYENKLLPKWKKKFIEQKKMNIKLKKTLIEEGNEISKIKSESEKKILQLIDHLEEEKHRFSKLETKKQRLLSQVKSYRTQMKTEETKRYQNLIRFIPNLQSQKTIFGQLDENGKKYLASVNIQKCWKGFVTRKHFYKVRKRLNICTEIYETEFEYVSRLSTLLENFLIPIGENEFLPKKELKTYQNEVEIILNLSKKILNRLKVIVKEIKINSKVLIGKVFVELSPAMIVYTTYVNRYSIFYKLIKESAAKSSKFQKFLVEQKRLGQLRLSLFDFLIAPVQRIPRYSLLLASLLRTTDKDHPDHPFLATALKKIDQQAQFLNNNKQQFTNLSKLFSVSSRLRNNESFNLLDTPSRSYIIQFEINLFIKNRSFKRLAVLFNDILIIVKTETKRKNVFSSKDIVYNFQSKLKLAPSLQITELIDDKRGENLLEITDTQNEKYHLVLQIIDTDIKTKCLNMIKRLMYKSTTSEYPKNFGKESNIIQSNSQSSQSSQSSELGLFQND